MEINNEVEKPEENDSSSEDGSTETASPRQNEISAAEQAQKEILYMRAELDNYKKRILREQDQAIKFGNERFIKETLGIIDHLDRALAHAKPLKMRTEDKELDNFISGIEMTHRELVQLLTRFGVEFIGTVGEKFDPARHEAISQQESPTAEPETVLDVLQKGSLLQGRLLRPARVIVARKKEE